MKIALVLCLLASTSPALADEDVKAPAGGLGREELKAGMAMVKDDVASCGHTYSKVKGIVKVKIEVAPDGHVEKASLKATPDRALGACIVSVIEHKATFAPTPHGGNFDYPYAF